MAAEALAPPRRSRIGLYGPFLALALLAVGWSVAWFVIRERVVSGLDEWVAAEAASGRRWSCPERSVAGYPFRIEITCPSVGLERPDVAASLGRLLVVAQVYRPGHLIAEAAGPLRIQAGPDGVEATWSLLQASIVTGDGLQRVAVVADAPRIRLASRAAGQLAIAARRLESHLRPDPAAPATADFALAAGAAVLPGLDGLIGGQEAADVDVVMTISKAYDLPARPLWSELERWRLAGGQAVISRIAVVKGPRRIEARGSLGIDELHRPEARIEASAAGIEGALGRLIGDGSGLAAGLLGALLGPPKAEIRQQPADADPALRRMRPLPPLRIEGGRVLVGPLAIPGLRVPPLY